MTTLPMLPSKPSDAMRSLYVSRVIAMYAVATDEQRHDGDQWYPVARTVACESGDARMGAGILAALSANKSWPENVRLARLAFRGRFGGHFADALDKSRAIYRGVPPEDVLPMASKTGQFYRCINDPSDPDAVVVDRHAHDVCAGMKYGNADRGLSSVGRYASIADAYRTAGKVLGVVPLRLQAIVWTVVTDAARYSRTLTGVDGWGMS